MRLARLTTAPKTSPSRSSTRPLAMPTRTSDRASSSRNVAAMSTARAAPDTHVVGHEHDLVADHLDDPARGAARSGRRRCVSNRPTTSASWCSGSSWVWAVKPDQVGEARRRRSRPRRRWPARCGAGRPPPRWRRHTMSMMWGIRGSTSPAPDEGQLGRGRIVVGLAAAGRSWLSMASTSAVAIRAIDEPITRAICSARPALERALLDELDHVAQHLDVGLGEHPLARPRIGEAQGPPEGADLRRPRPPSGRPPPRGRATGVSVATACSRASSSSTPSASACATSSAGTPRASTARAGRRDRRWGRSREDAP